MVLVESFGRKRVFRVKCRCLSVFANKWLCEVLENDFWDGWNLNFSVDYDRAMCQERVGENDIKIRLTVRILCAKWWKRKNSCAVSRARPCVWMAQAVCTLCPFWHGRACARHGPCVLSGLRFSRFFTHFCFELAFDVNMKVLDNFVSFPMDLVWLEFFLWILSYDENTPSGSWRNFKKT